MTSERMSSEEPTFERFLQAVRGTNPFRSHRITDVGGGEATVASIHKNAFTKLTRVVQDAAKEPVSIGALLIGAPGVGKSHLLARLFQWAGEDKATVVYLHNILASPERMLRYVLHATVSDLAGHRGSDYTLSRLYSILNRALIRSGAFKNRKTMMGPKEIEARKEALARLGARIDPHNAVIPVLNAFLTGTSHGSLGDAAAEKRAHAAVLWLSGETLGPDEARLLDGARLLDNARPLDPAAGAADDGLALPDDAAVERVLHVLAHLCALAELPLVLCLDQVDNLDPDAVRALMSYAHALLDRAKHLVVIVSGVKQSMLSLRTGEVIPAAAWDRIAERILELHMISPEEARAILEGRLDAALSGFHEIEEVIAARRRDRLFPLGSGWLEQRLDGVQELRPRDAILWARDRWEAQQDRLAAVGGKRWLKEWPGPGPDGGREPAPAPKLEDVIDAEVKKKLEEGKMRRRLQQASLPPDEDNLASLTHHLLARCAGQNGATLLGIEHLTAKKRGKAPAYHLLAREKRADGVIVTTGVTFVCAPSGHGARMPLQRMADDTKTTDKRILVTDEERRPLRLGGAGKAAYDALCKLGRQRFLHLHLDFAGHAELDSLVGLLGAARSQDLEIEHPRGQYRKVTEAEVLASFQRQSLLLAHPLLRELLTEEIVKGGTDSVAPPPWDPQQTREHIMAELSWRLGLMARELAQIFATRKKVQEKRFPEVWAHIKKTAQALHDEGHVHATATDDDLFVQLRGKK
ncbi:ATP-binding protein [Sorangium sp. So ce1024]|uniref:ATP-binding protein n=1 Tax=unclassified Sorangium TaxID=2621164 RepID=UPI003F0D15EB